MEPTKGDIVEVAFMRMLEDIGPINDWTGFNRDRLNAILARIPSLQDFAIEVIEGKSDIRPTPKELAREHGRLSLDKLSKLQGQCAVCLRAPDPMEDPDLDLSEYPKIRVHDLPKAPLVYLHDFGYEVIATCEPCGHVLIWVESAQEFVYDENLAENLVQSHVERAEQSADVLHLRPEATKNMVAKALAPELGPGNIHQNLGDCCICQKQIVLTHLLAIEKVTRIGMMTMTQEMVGGACFVCSQIFEYMRRRKEGAEKLLEVPAFDLESMIPVGQLSWQRTEKDAMMSVPNQCCMTGMPLIMDRNGQRRFPLSERPGQISFKICVDEEQRNVLIGTLCYEAAQVLDGLFSEHGYSPDYVRKNDLQEAISLGVDLKHRL